jgi:membrane protein YdbS with pleckstrin-like domain
VTSAAASAADRPLVSLHSHFEPLMVMYHHPVRLTTSLLIPLFLLPEFSALVQKYMGLGTVAAPVFVVAMIIFLVFLPQLFVSALDCKKVSYDFHKDHFSFTESFLLREPIRVPYKNVIAVTARQGRFQKIFHLADIVIETQPVGRLETRSLFTVIRDVRLAPRAVRKINLLLDAFRQDNQGVAADGPEGMTKR